MEMIDDKMDRRETQMKTEFKSMVGTMVHDMLKTEVSNQLEECLKDTKNDINYLKDKMNRLLQHLMPPTTTPTVPAPDVNPPQTTTMATNKESQSNVLIDTPSPASPKKTSLATPIHKWHHPRRVTKARTTPVVKKLTDKSDRLNRSLTNFFNPLADTHEDSENQMEDDSIQP
jgi:hypothetical protein